MVLMYVLPLVLALILSVTYLFSFRISSRFEKQHESILSIGSGMTMAILFAQIIPDIIEQGPKFLSGEMLGLSMLTGFVGYHLIERYTYKHTRKTLLSERIGYLHAAGFFVDNFLEGFVLVLIFGLESITSYVVFLLFIPLLLGDIAASTMLRHINDKFRLGWTGLIFMSSSIMIGALSALFLNLSESTFYIALSMISGAFVYFITRDELPRGRKGKPLLFVGSLIIVLALFFVVRRII